MSKPSERTRRSQLTQLPKTIEKKKKKKKKPAAAAAAPPKQPEVKVREYPLSDNFWQEIGRLCPECRRIRTSYCKCRLQDSECSQGHQWHFHHSDDRHFLVNCASTHASHFRQTKCPLCLKTD